MPIIGLLQDVGWSDQFHVDSERIIRAQTLAIPADVPAIVHLATPTDHILCVAFADVDHVMIECERYSPFCFNAYGVVQPQFREANCFLKFGTDEWKYDAIQISCFYGPLWCVFAYCLYA
jgi:hypothetical protein